ncbi:holin family protein [Phaeovulum vinaykumarii]|uniref:Holin of 3TMs, for gene-transfer release n=1 Tax=Phaeovulum vinaykumarii TaxID=407234 RepID=A0A1N7MVB8_9RHOB|nr:holin family protein [Phaeovulum vinaykumarii]SIS89891.1 Holin of 3TMs, for gene-transfer release [Phaeovulum vinaykumarii]SOC16972.1 holin (3TMs family) [Phaeovulum vinaykumarii]
MGLIARLIGTPEATRALAGAASSVAEVFTPNATRALETAHEVRMAALAQHGTEFQSAGAGLFDRLVNGLNRLPRPMLALGTLGLFVHAMVDPAGFTTRMQGLAAVPEPLWWLLGAIVSFYFGAREAHHFRVRSVATAGRLTQAPRRPGAGAAPTASPDPGPNPALAEWQGQSGP